MSDIAKRNAAALAVAEVQDGMTVGLGTGSTAAHFIALLGARVQAGLAITAVATSHASERLAREAGIGVIEPNAAGQIALAVDGADEVDGAHHLIKGGGGALLREKIIAAAAARFLVIVDDAKLRAQLGAYALPVEVTAFGHVLTARAIGRALREAGVRGDGVRLRLGADGAPFVSDGGNLIYDCACGEIADPRGVARALEATPGVAGHGLFIAMADAVIVGDTHGARYV